MQQVPGGGGRESAKETRVIALNEVTVRCKGARGVIDAGRSVVDTDTLDGGGTGTGDAETRNILVVTM